MKIEEIVERGFSFDEYYRIIDDFGNEFRNENGEIEFLENEKI